MNYIELTRPDNTSILVNKNSIVSVLTYGGNTVLLYVGGHRQEIKETYDQVKSMLINPLVLNG